MFADVNAGGAVGYFAIAFTLVCALLHYVVSTYLNATFFTFFVTSAAAVMVVLGLYFLIFRLAAGSGSGEMFVARYLPRMGLTLLCAVPLYCITGFLHNTLTATKEYARFSPTFMKK
jgi:hypothetical protein